MDESRQWLLRLMGLMLILAMVMGYQMKAQAWQRQREQNEAAVRAAEQYNAEIQAEQNRNAAQNQKGSSQYQQGQSGSGQTPALNGSGQGGAAGASGGAGSTGAPQTYRDGSYTASGRGFGGNITLTVTISGGNITNITINDASAEDKVYFDMAVKLIDDIIADQSPDVDAVTGATYSSNGIKDAVRAALEEAEQ